MSRQQLASLLLATALYTGAGHVLMRGLGLKAEEVGPPHYAYQPASPGEVAALQVRMQPARQPAARQPDSQPASQLCGPVM